MKWPEAMCWIAFWLMVAVFVRGCTEFVIRHPEALK